MVLLFAFQTGYAIVMLSHRHLTCTIGYMAVCPWSDSFSAILRASEPTKGK